MADASVKVTIEAVAAAAQERVDEFGDEVEGLGGSAELAQRALSSLADELSDAGRNAAGLAGVIGRVSGAARRAAPGVNSFKRSVDDLGDESVGTAAQLGVLRGVMFAFLDATDSNVIGARALSGVLGAALIPAIVGLGAALVPLIGYLGVAAGALGGVAIGMGAIVGAGVIAELEGVTAAVKKMIPEVRKIITAWGSRFTPMIYDAIDAFPTLVKRILDSINGVEKFQQALIDLGNWAMTGIPAIVDEFTRLGVMAMPVLRELAGFINSNAKPALDALLRSLEQNAQAFRDLAEATPAFLGSLLSLGTKVLNAVVPALTALFNVTTDLAGALRNPPQQFQFSMSRLNTATSKAGDSVGRLWNATKPLLKQLVRFGALVFSLGVDLTSMLVPGIVTVIDWSTEFMKVVNNLIKDFVRWGKQTGNLKKALALLYPTIIGIAAALGLISNPILLAVAAISSLYLAWKTNLFGIRDITKNVINFVLGIWNRINQIWTTTKRVFNQTVAFLSRSTTGIQEHIRNTVNTVLRVWGRLSRLYTELKKNFDLIIDAVTFTMNWINNKVIKPTLKQIEKLWKLHGEEIVTGVKQFTKFIANVINFALDGLRVVWDLFFKHIITLLEGFIEGFILLLKGLRKLALVIWNAFGDELLGVLQFAFDMIRALVGAFADTVITLFTAFTDLLVGDWRGALDKLMGLARRIFDGIRSFVQTWANRFTDTIRGLVNTVISAFQDLKRKIEGAIDRMISNVTSTISNWDIVGTVRGLVRDAVGAVEGMVSDFKNAGKALIQGLIDGIQDKVDDAKGAVKGLTDTIGSYLPGSDAEEGALSNLSSYGPAIVDMLRSGMVSNMRALERASSQVARAAFPPMMRGRPGMRGGGGQVVNFGGIKVEVHGDADGEEIAREIGKNLPNELRSRGLN